MRSFLLLLAAAAVSAAVPEAVRSPLPRTPGRGLALPRATAWSETAQRARCGPVARTGWLARQT